MIGNKRSGVFLSYARKDEQFAGALREKLRTEAPDISIKQDRLVLDGGVGWWKHAQGVGSGDRRCHRHVHLRCWRNLLCNRRHSHGPGWRLLRPPSLVVAGP